MEDSFSWVVCSWLWADHVKNEMIPVPGQSVGASLFQIALLIATYSKSSNKIKNI